MLPLIQICSKIFGFAAVIALLLYLVGYANIRYYIDAPSLGIVAGGTIGMLLATFGLHGLRSLWLALMGYHDHFQVGRMAALMGGLYALGLGAIGTGIAFVGMLQNLNDPSALGVGVAVITLCYLYGLFICCCIFLPFFGIISAKMHSDQHMKIPPIVPAIALFLAGAPLIQGIFEFMFLASIFHSF